MTEARTKYDRRTYLAALSAAGGGALAGCLGDDDGDDTGDPDLGEQVGTVSVGVLGGTAASTEWEQATNHLVDVLEDLGVDTEIDVQEFTTFFEAFDNDTRPVNFHIDFVHPSPDTVDPHAVFDAFTITSAGANGLQNVVNYASCDFSTAHRAQQRASDPEDRDESIMDALHAASDDILTISLFSGNATGAYLTDQVDISHPGEIGLNDLNPKLLIESEPVGDTEILSVNVSQAVVESDTYPTNQSPVLWSNLVYSSLVMWDENRDLEASLAENWEDHDDFTRFVFELREDATFHNGDPVTASDVKFTHELLENNREYYIAVDEQNYESIDVIDEHTVEFNFAEPNPVFLTTHAPMWGIVPEDVWIEGGAEDDPSNIDHGDEYVGSGPYELVNYEQGSLMQMVPNEDHWNTPAGELALVHYEDETASFIDFQGGDLNIIINTSEGTNDEIVNTMEDEAELVTIEGSMAQVGVYPQHNFGVSMFEEFRDAYSHAIDRDFMIEMIEHGNAEPMLFASPLGLGHPYYPEDGDGLRRIAESETGDIDIARDILEEHNWGWDSDGNLHYPPDADTDPLWPEGDEPRDYPDQFECIDELT